MYARADKVSNWAERIADRTVGVFSERTRATRAHNRLLGRDDSYGSAYRMMSDRMTGKRSSLARRDPKANDRHATPWLGLSNRDADGDQIPLLERRRQRSRFIEKSDGIGSGIFGTRQRKVVGSGLRVQVRSDDDAVNDAYEEVWNERKDLLFPAEGNLSHAAGQRMIFGRRDVDGDIGLCPTVTKPGEPLWFEVIEGDRIATPIDAKVPAGHKLVEGVEKDSLGRTLQYWVHKRHPGEVILSPWVKGWTPVPPKSATSFVQVSAERCKLLRRGVTRPGQSRGLPLFHAAEQDIHDIDLLLHATLKRAQISACLTLFITSDSSIADLFPDDDGKTDEENWGYDVGESLKPGEFFRLAAGEKIESTAKTPVAPDLEPFIWVYARRIGAAVGLSPQAVLGDRGKASFSAARTVELEDRISVDLARKDFAAEVLDWQFRLVIADAIRRGDPRLAFSSVEEAMTIKIRWVGDARHWVDPKKEVDAIETALRLNLTTLEIEAMALGHDWEELMVQRAKEKDFAEGLGLSPDVVPVPATAASDPAPAAGRVAA